MQSVDTRRNRWPSAPPPAMTPPGRSLIKITLIGAIWVAVGAASAAYVATRTHEARPGVAATDADR